MVMDFVFLVHYLGISQDRSPISCAHGRYIVNKAQVHLQFTLVACWLVNGPFITKRSVTARKTQIVSKSGNIAYIYVHLIFAKALNNYGFNESVLAKLKCVNRSYVIIISHGTRIPCQ